METDSLYFFAGETFLLLGSQSFKLEKPVRIKKKSLSF